MGKSLRRVWKIRLPEEARKNRGINKNYKYTRVRRNISQVRVIVNRARAFIIIIIIVIIIVR